jgi:hypothetical protein
MRVQEAFARSALYLRFLRGTRFLLFIRSTSADPTGEKNSSRVMDSSRIMWYRMESFASDGPGTKALSTTFQE